MTCPLVTIRPEPGASETVARASEMGLTVESWPLSQVCPSDWQAPAADKYDGLLLGSANAVRHAGGQLERLAGLPVYAVGEQTAEAARAAGLHVVRTGAGNLQSMLDMLAGERLRLLRLTGEKHMAVVPPSGITVDVLAIYKVEHLPVPAALAEQLRRGAAVLLHSGEAAAHFARECDRLRLPRERIAIVALAPRIAERAGGDWRAVTIAAAPDDAALLAAAAQVCEEAR